MTEQAAADEVTAHPPIAPQMRQGPGAFAWISLALLALAAETLVFAVVTGAYGLTLVSIFAVFALSIPTLILMGVWIEVWIDNRAALKRYETETIRGTNSSPGSGAPALKR